MTYHLGMTVTLLPIYGHMRDGWVVGLPHYGAKNIGVEDQQQPPQQWQERRWLGMEGDTIGSKSSKAQVSFKWLGI